MTPDEYLRVLIGDLIVQLAMARAERDAARSEKKKPTRRADASVAEDR